MKFRTGSLRTGVRIAASPQNNSTNGWLSGLSPESASLDRLDNTRGYVQGNVRFVAVMANFARNKFSDQEVLRFAKAVTAHARPEAEVDNEETPAPPSPRSV